MIGKGIRADADSRNLNIERVQDTAACHGKQQNSSLQITAANTEINQHLDGLKKQLIEIDEVHHECGDEICKQHIL